jgi:hypothetical protein
MAIIRWRISLDLLRWGGYAGSRAGAATPRPLSSVPPFAPLPGLAVAYRRAACRNKIRSTAFH